MFKLSDKATKFVLTSIAIISVIATVLVGIISNSAEISKEVIAKIDEAERKASVTSQMGTVNIKYVDVNGTEIAPSDSITGNVGSEYKATRKSVATYAPCGEEPYNKAGNFEIENQEVRFVYEKEDSSVEVSEENNTVTVTTLHSRNVKEIDVKIVTKDEKGNLIKGVAYKVTDSDGKLLRNGKVQGDTFVAGTLTVADEGTRSFTIEEDAGTYYQTLIDSSIEFTLNKVWNGSEYIANISHGSYEGVEFDDNISDGDFIITITNKEREGGNIFDLQIKKYVKKVVVKENGNNVKEIDSTVGEKDNLIKIDIAKSKLNNTKVEVTYGLVIENVGNIPGNAVEIMDILPEGFTYVSGGNWEVSGNTLKTTDLKDITLEPGEATELDIVTEWNVAQNELGLRQNKAEITDYYNEPELDDKTPDNIDTADVMATIKTGGDEVKVGTILLVLNIALIVVYGIKKIKRGEIRDEK